MIDATPAELSAMARVLKPLGEAVAEIGMDKPLAHYTREEILTLVEVVISNYQIYLLEEQNRNQEAPF